MIAFAVCLASWFEGRRITDPRGNRTLLDYDSAGRVEEIVRVTDDYAGTGPTWTFEYHTGDGRCPGASRSNEMEDP